MKTNKRNRIVSIALSILLFALAAAQVPCIVAEAVGTKTLSLKQAQQLALANSKEYKRTVSKIEMQQVKYTAAVKSIQMKKKNMSTFRWTPLLSFKFPEQPALADAYEWQYKPIQISSQIDVLRHQLIDVTYSSKEEISLLYVQAYILQEKIAYTEEQRDGMQDTLNRNRVRAVTGDASEHDITKMEQSVEKLTIDLATQMKQFETVKERISKIIKMDITVNYRFENPFLEADIPRSALPELIQYTLEHDHSFYEAKMNTAVNRISLEMNESLMRGQYGSKMNMIQSYVNQAKNGEEIDGYAFRKKYNDFLKKIDEPWDGKFRILFIRIPREWFKGSIDGSRYVEDDPYALYTSALDYADARAEQEKLQSQLEQSVKDGYENLITIRNAYQSSAASVEKLKKEVDRAKVRNQMGELSYEELTAVEEEYSEFQMETLEMLAEYSSQLYSFDRLTCGGVSTYLEEGNFTAGSEAGGDSFVKADEIEGAYYYIESKVEDNIFLFGIHIPDDFTIDITDYELWVNGVRIGERTPAGEAIRHLALDFESVESCQVYLYQNEELEAVCDIDSSVNRAALELKGNYRVETDGRKEVASFVCSEDVKLQKMEITITPNSDEPIAAYRIQAPEGTAVYSGQNIPIEESFTYLSVLKADLGKISVLFYDSAGEQIYEGRFDTLNGTIYVEETENLD